ncbi:hypothetical protein K438DRAFT_1765965 [Mycena galopus ATCC 62051]|nr:hypothetical protein K438DRAFT_1765965 [Mycena galopus ATCC 62051]
MLSSGPNDQGLSVTEGIYESSKQVTKSPKNGSKIEFSPPRRLLVKRRRSVPHEVPVLTDATFKVNFFCTPFSPSSSISIHLETKQRLLLGHVDSWHINTPVLVIGVSPECRVLRVRAADVFARGFSSGSDKHAIRFWNLSIRILRLTRRNKTCGGDFPVLAVFLEGKYKYLSPSASFRPIYEKKLGVTLDPTQVRKVNFVRRGHRSQVADGQAGRLVCIEGKRTKGRRNRTTSPPQIPSTGFHDDFIPVLWGIYFL